MHLNKPHICFVAPEIYPVLAGGSNLKTVGGAEVQQAFIARGLRDAGYQVSVASFDYGQPDDAVLEDIQVHKIHIEGPRIPVLRYFHPRLTGIWGAMSRANADIYYQRCAGAYTGTAAAFAYAHGRRFIFANANDQDLVPDDCRVKLWRDRQLFYWGLRQASAVVAQNQFQVDACRQYHNRNATLIPSGYQLPIGATAHKEGVVLWVSVMRRGKRPDLILTLAERLPHVRFRMIGGRSTTGFEDDYFDEIQAKASKLPNLEFIGFLPAQEVEKHFSDARIFVSTSESEGFPNTFLQSWARGVPTISFVDCGARVAGQPIGSIVSNLEEMRIAIEALWKDDSRWEKEGERAKLYFSVFHSPQTVIARYSELLDGLTIPRAHGI